MKEQEIIDFLYKIKKGCEGRTCFNCFFRSEGSKKCILNGPPETWDLARVEYNKKIAK